MEFHDIQILFKSWEDTTAGQRRERGREREEHVPTNASAPPLHKGACEYMCKGI